jgi:hypothetical protein
MFSEAKFAGKNSGFALWLGAFGVVCSGLPPLGLFLINSEPADISRGGKNLVHIEIDKQGAPLLKFELSF